jgi:hypothetical protein
MNQLPTDGKCQRCREDAKVTSMSRFNTQMCCMNCLDLEKKHPKYHVAETLEIAAIKQGRYNFQGIGLPSGYSQWEKQQRQRQDI